MQIALNDAGRRYNAHWVFKHLTYTFNAGNSYALLGPNGSGKSTLLQVLTGSLHPSKGEIRFLDATGHPIPTPQVYRLISVAAPYTTLIDDMPLAEAVDFHFSFKNYKAATSKQLFFQELGFATRTHIQPLKQFSSGMRQRVKLLLAMFSDTPVLALDEPTMNLDTQGRGWYLNLVGNYVHGQLVLVASNDEGEYGFCTTQIKMADLK